MSSTYHSIDSRRRAVSRSIWRTEGSLNSKLDAVFNGSGRALIILLSEGEMSDHQVAASMLDVLPKAKYAGQMDMAKVGGIMKALLG